MIGKINIGKSFGGCIHYCLNDKVQQQAEAPVMKDRAEVLLYNQCYGNEKELIQQFNEVRQLNNKLSKPVMHIMLSLTPGEQLSRVTLMDICQDCAKDMGFAQNQFIAIHHKDTGHQHLHIVANRIGFDRKTIRDSGNYQRMAKFCRSMELKYGLEKVLSPRKFLSPEQRLLPRQNQRQEELENNIRQTLIEVNNYTAFEQQMTALGYTVLKGRGISFTDTKGVKIKGSEVGFSLAKIERVLALKTDLSAAKKNLQNGEGYQQSATRLLLEKRYPGTENYGSNKEIELVKNISKLLTDLLKPEQIVNEEVNTLLLKKKKRRQHHHM